MALPDETMRLLFSSVWTAGWVTTALGRMAAGDVDAMSRLQPSWARGLLRYNGITVESEGGERLDPRATYVFMANHQSNMDIASLFVALPVVPGFLAKRELVRVPFLAQALLSGGHVLIDRTKRKEALAAIDEAAAQVRTGRSIVLFPEGTRSLPGTVKPLKKGGFHLAKKAAVPLVPVGIRGTAEVLPRDSLRIRPGRVRVRVGAPIAPEEVLRAPVAELMERVRAELAALTGFALREEPRARAARSPA